ncbi:MAG: hypothetical protein U0R17_00230 [Acidimicrobiia bacterium]
MSKINVRKIRNTLAGVVGVTSVAVPVGATINLFSDASALSDSAKTFQSSDDAVNALSTQATSDSVSITEQGRVQIITTANEIINRDSLDFGRISDFAKRMQDLDKELKDLQEIYYGGGIGLTVAKFLRKKNPSPLAKDISADRRSTVLSIFLEQRLAFAVLLLSSGTATGLLWNYHTAHDYQKIRDVDTHLIAQSLDDMDRALKDLDVQVRQQPKSQTLTISFEPNVPAIEKLTRSNQAIAGQNPGLTDLDIAGDKVFMSLVPFVLIGGAGTLANGVGLLTGRNAKTREYMAEVRSLERTFFS